MQNVGGQISCIMGDVQVAYDWYKQFVSSLVSHQSLFFCLAKAANHVKDTPHVRNLYITHEGLRKNYYCKQRHF